MSLQVGQTVEFTKSIELGDNIKLTIAKGHKGKVVGVNENTYSVEVYEGIIAHDISSDSIMYTEENWNRISEKAKKFHKEFFPDQKKAMEQPGFHPHAETKEG